MKELISSLVKELTGLDEVTINTHEPSEGYFEYEIILPQSVIGLVIGKNGKTINAIRQLVKVRATLEKTHVRLNVVAQEEVAS